MLMVSLGYRLGCQHLIRSIDVSFEDTELNRSRLPELETLLLH